MWGYVEANSPQLSPLFKSCHAPLLLASKCVFCGRGVTDGSMIFSSLHIISIFSTSLPKCGKFGRDMVLWICHFPSFFKQCLTSLFAPKCSKFDRDLAEMWEMDLPFLLIPLALSPCWSAQHWWASRSNLSAFKWLISVKCVFYCILRFL